MSVLAPDRSASAKRLAETKTATTRPLLCFVYSPTSGPSRRAEGFLAQVLQRRKNHRAFIVQRINCIERPDLAKKLGAETVPALVVVENRRVRARLEGVNGCKNIERLLEPWLGASDGDDAAEESLDEEEEDADEPGVRLVQAGPGESFDRLAIGLPSGLDLRAVAGGREADQRRCGCVDLVARRLGRLRRGPLRRALPGRCRDRRHRAANAPELRLGGPAVRRLPPAGHVELRASLGGGRARRRASRTPGSTAPKPGSGHATSCARRCARRGARPQPPAGQQSRAFGSTSPASTSSVGGHAPRRAVSTSLSGSSASRIAHQARNRCRRRMRRPRPPLPVSPSPIRPTSSTSRPPIPTRETRTATTSRSLPRTRAAARGRTPAAGCRAAAAG